MNFKKATLNGVEILKSGIIYTKTNWKQLGVDDSSSRVDGTHSRIVSPTYARVRIITLEGLIDRIPDNGIVDGTYSAQEFENINHLQNLFALQGDLFEVEEKSLVIEDNYNQKWEIKVKVKTPLEILDADDDFYGSYYRWRVVLESVYSPIYYSYEEKNISGRNGKIGGLKLGVKLPKGFNNYIYKITTNNNGNFQTPAIFELELLKNTTGFIKIFNITKKTFFKINGDFVSGDKIIIDSINKTITKNGENILANREQGSIWQHIVQQTEFIVFDAGMDLEEKIKVKIRYKDALL